VLVAPLAAQLLQVALPDLPIDRVYTGILSSNKHLSSVIKYVVLLPASMCRRHLLVDSYCFHACPESSIGFRGMVHFPLHSSLISVFSNCFQWQRSWPRVAIWAESQRMDMLLTGIPHFRVPTRRRIDHGSIAAPAQKLIGNMSCFVPLSLQVPSLAFAATKRCLQSGNHDLLGSRCFVAAGVLTTGMTT
jgi:hypothetical protein